MSDDTKTDQAKYRPPIRLAFRHEGDKVNCYLADMHTMEDAQFIGCVPVAACDMDKQIFQDFKALMQKVFTVACVQTIGVAPSSFHDQPAPEHEKAGHA